MITKGSVRRKSSEMFKEVIRLRKLGHSYSEIRQKTSVSKSTINNWITYAGLNISKEHLLIQKRKRVENHVLGTMASKITRAKRKDEDIQKFILEMRPYFRDPHFVAGIMLYEAEGSKGDHNGFSNSDFKVLNLYLNFLERYLNVDRNKDISFRLYIHEIRSDDLGRIKSFWSKKLGIDKGRIAVSWKRNTVTKRRENLDYVGQISCSVNGISHLTSKILAISDIILSEYSKIS